MVGRAGSALIARAVRTETVSTHQTAVNQKLQSAIDCSERNVKPLGLKLAVEAFDREMVRCAHCAIEYGETLGSPTFMMLGEIV